MKVRSNWKKSKLRYGNDGKWIAFAGGQAPIAPPRWHTFPIIPLLHEGKIVGFMQDGFYGMPDFVKDKGKWIPANDPLANASIPRRLEANIWNHELKKIAAGDLNAIQSFVKQYGFLHSPLPDHKNIDSLFNEYLGFVHSKNTSTPRDIEDVRERFLQAADSLPYAAIGGVYETNMLRKQQIEKNEVIGDCISVREIVAVATKLLLVQAFLQSWETSRNPTTASGKVHQYARKTFPNIYEQELKRAFTNDAEGFLALGSEVIAILNVCLAEIRNHLRITTYNIKEEEEPEGVILEGFRQDLYFGSLTEAIAVQIYNNAIDPIGYRQCRNKECKVRFKRPRGRARKEYDFVFRSRKERFYCSDKCRNKVSYKKWKDSGGGKQDDTSKAPTVKHGSKK
ncbi:MAG: hypothetical protein FWE26_04080 [Coriobacteriia bacterium]|nr:hypothetical protein [Coriobacteriia bacterium]MCL2870790.1 hypothetical protein [Coriobacteriia bacterium]